MEETMKIVLNNIQMEHGMIKNAMINYHVMFANKYQLVAYVRLIHMQLLVIPVVQVVPLESLANQVHRHVHIIQLLYLRLYLLLFRLIFLGVLIYFIPYFYL